MICKTRHKWEVSHCMLTSIIFDGNAQAKRRFLHKSTAHFDKPRLSSQGDRQYQHPNQNRSGTVSALSALRGCASFLREVWMPRPPMTRWTLKYSFEPLSHAAEKHCLRRMFKSLAPYNCHRSRHRGSERLWITLRMRVRQEATGGLYETSGLLIGEATAVR